MTTGHMTGTSERIGSFRSGKPYRVCTRCVMDTTDPRIAFDDDGQCNHCRDWFRRLQLEVPESSAREGVLSKLVDQIKRAGQKREYDCIIGVSGGVDSTFVAYTVKRLGLRPLAVHFDNGWNTEEATHNIANALQGLGIDLQTYVVDWEEFRDLQLAVLRSSVENAEMPTDHAIQSLLLRTAIKTGTPFILHGGNVRTEGIMPIAWSYFNQDYRLLRSIHKQFGTRPLRTMPLAPLSLWFRAFFVHRIRYIPILNYVSYDKGAAIATLVEELGYKPYGAKHYESLYTRFFQGFILPKKFGYDKRRAHLSCLVCAGEVSRDEALAVLEKDPYTGSNLEADRTFFLKKMRLSQADFDSIMSQPPRTYRDYPNTAWVFERSRKTKTLMKRLMTGKT